MIRILHVVTQMNRGGLETMLMNYYRAIDKSKVQFDFLVHRSDKGAYDDEILGMGGYIFHLDRLNPFSLKYRKELALFFKMHNEYLVVHSHINTLSALVLKYAKLNGVPVRVSHSHISDNQSFSLKNAIKLYYRTQISKYTTHQFACGIRAGRWLYRSDSFEVIPNAIDAEHYRYNDAIRKKIRSDLEISNEFVLGNIGRFTKQKNQIFLVEIFSSLLKVDQNALLLLVGDGEELPLVKQLTHDLKIEKQVRFLGIRSDIPNLLQAMDVFVMPSLFEGLPVTMVEAQASGLPCIISDTISEECILTKNVTICKLSESKEAWARYILTTKEKKRKDTYQEIVESRYDIRSNAKYLQDFYLNQWNNNLKR